jgi:hypothetical protein
VVALCGMARDDPHLRVRISEALKARIEAAAASSGRSVTAEIVSRLEKSLDEDPTISQLQGSVSLLQSKMDEVEQELRLVFTDRNLLARMIERAFEAIGDTTLTPGFKSMLKFSDDARKDRSFLRVDPAIPEHEEG